MKILSVSGCLASLLSLFGCHFPQPTDGPGFVCPPEYTDSTSVETDSDKVEMLDGPGYEYEPTEHDIEMQKMIEERKKNK